MEKKLQFINPREPNRQFTIQNREIEKIVKQRCDLYNSWTAAVQNKNLKTPLVQYNELLKFVFKYLIKSAKIGDKEP